MTDHLSTITPIEEHPAKFNQQILDVIADQIAAHAPVPPHQIISILDIFGGIGLIHELDRDLWDTYTVELQAGWAAASARRGYTYCGDWFEFKPGLSEFSFYEEEDGEMRWGAITSPREFEVIATSSTYGNRMADKHNAKEDSKRMTYAHTLRRNGEDIHPESSGGMQWGKVYKEFHSMAWHKACIMLPIGGILILNVKDHVRGGKLIPVSRWHRETIQNITGSTWYMEVIADVRVPVKGMGFGQHQTIEEGLKIDYEHVYVFRKMSTNT